MHTFCSIITADYLPFAKTVLASLKKYDAAATMHVLVINGDTANEDKSLIITMLPELTNHTLFQQLEKKYAHTNPDHLRWALKPVYMYYLLEKGFDRVIFTDPDLFFTGDYHFLLNELDKQGILLSPHHTVADPMQDEENFLMSFRIGLFNAGFIAASANGKPALQWWAMACAYNIKQDTAAGLYDDQKYLDMMPVLFDNTSIIRHPGCNLGSWNMQTCKRSLSGGKLVINERYEPVFIHFNRETITQVLNRNDALLRPALDEYIQLLSGIGFDLIKNLDSLPLHKYDSALYSFKHKLRLRTRLKRFLYRLAEKL